MCLNNIKNLPLDQLIQQFKELGLEGYRAEQVRRWLFAKDAASFDEMTNIAKRFREVLAEKYRIVRLEVQTRQQSADGTIKFLIGLPDGNKIEAVWIPSEDRRTLCVSTQVGCAMGCAFCLTGTMGMIRNLELYEILEQVATVKRHLPAGETVSNIVFMGMGEPLANTKNLYPAINILIDNNGFAFSHNHVTVSTCGLAPEIAKFGDQTQAKLAISLNATTDEVRTQIMPINKKYNLAALVAACKKMTLHRRNRITFEYVMLHGINDSMDDAKRLVKLLAGIPAKINLLPFNEHAGSVYKRPPADHVKQFQQYLMDQRLVAIVRQSRGADILGACGQLATMGKALQTK